MESILKSSLFKRLAESVSKIKKLVDSSPEPPKDTKVDQPETVQHLTQADVEALRRAVSEGYARGCQDTRRLIEFRRQTKLAERRVERSVHPLRAVVAINTVSVISSKEASSSSESFIKSELDSSDENSTDLATDLSRDFSTDLVTDLSTDFSTDLATYLSTELSCSPASSVGDTSSDGSVSSETDLSSEESAASEWDLATSKPSGPDVSWSSHYPSDGSIYTSFATESEFNFFDGINNRGVNTLHPDFALDTG